MADDAKLTALALTIEAKTRSLEKGMERVEKIVSGTMGNIQKKSTQSMTAMERAMARAGRSAIGFGRNMLIAFGAGFTVREAQKLIDASTKIQNSLKVTGLEGKNLTAVYHSLFNSAQRSAVPIADIATLYSRASMAAGNLGASQKDLLKFTDAVAVSLRVSGKSAEEASGALLQLSQLLGGSVVQAQEYNSLIDGAYPLLQAVAAGLKEAGGDVAKLTQLVKSGKVPTKAFFDAFLAGSDILRDKLAGSELTVSQSFVRMQNVLIDTAGKINDVTKVSDHLTTALNGLADSIHDLDVEGFINKMSRAETAAHSFLSELGNSSIFEKLNQLLGITDAKGNLIPIETKDAKDKVSSLETSVKMAQATIANQTKFGIDTKEAEAKLKALQADLAKARGHLASLPASVAGQVLGNPTNIINAAVPFKPLEPLDVDKKKRVSLADYSLKPGVGAGGKGRRGIRRTADDRFDDDIQDIKDRTDALKQEREAMGLSFREQQKRRIAFDLEKQTLEDVRKAARQKGDADWRNVQLSKDQKDAIDAVSDAYAKQADALRKAQEMQALETDVLKSAFEGVRNALEDGKITAKEWGNIVLDALDKISDRREDHILESLIGA